MHYKCSRHKKAKLSSTIDTSNHSEIENSIPVHSQGIALQNLTKFHNSLKCTIYHCKICQEPWPLKTKPKNYPNYICSRCSRDKCVPKKFSNENLMIPSPVPKKLQDLTQFEEMLIARAFPVMHVYTKARGGQRAYKGHVITLPQDVRQLTDVLPRCPKDLPVIIFTVNGKDNRPFYSCVLSYLAMNACEAGGDLALIQTFKLLSCKCQLVSMRTT